jgi:kumamolisin
VSQVFGRPWYQFLVPTGASMRAVPDISLQMGGCPAGISELPCPQDGTARSYSLIAFGFGTSAQGYYGLIGTSISAPGFAGLLALEEQYLGGIRLGNVNAQIYTLAALQGTGSHGPFAGIFHRNIPGFNGAEHSGGNGYNQVLGAGTPDVRKFILAPQLPAAGTPQTPSNP